MPNPSGGGDVKSARDYFNFHKTLPAADQILPLKFLGLGPITGGACCYCPLDGNLKKFHTGHIKTRGGRSPVPGFCLPGPKNSLESRGPARKGDQG